jgi:hypothetical protein
MHKNLCKSISKNEQAPTPYAIGACYLQLLLTEPTIMFVIPTKIPR